jgi:hypothetical protein
MKQVIAIVFLACGLSVTANADIWKWVDEQGTVHYGDMAARADAVNAERISHASSSRSASRSGNSPAVTSRGNDSKSGEARDDAQEGENARAYYCKQATDIYESYATAPRLYRTGADGKREYLSDEETAATLAEAKASMAEWCN